MANLKDIINGVAADLEISKKDSDQVIRAAFKKMTELLVEEKEVSIPGIGKFVIVTQSARKCRNPQTGEAMEVPAKDIPKFKASATLKDLVAGK